MTICIAAIGMCEELRKEDEAIVFATDHMITLPQIGQFEHSIEKYRRVNSNTIAMLSGEALLFEDVLDGIVPKDSFDGIKDKIHKNMSKVRDERIKKIIFDKLKIDFDYLKEILKNPEHNDIITDILQTIKEFNLATSVIVGGFKNNKAQIAEINEMIAVNTRDINFNAIGSGGTQAINTLLFQRHSKTNNLKTTLYNVYKAKRNSEVAIGVGKETDLFILLSNGKLHTISGEDIKRLDEIYQAEMKFGKEHDELTRILKNLGG